MSVFKSQLKFAIRDRDCTVRLEYIQGTLISLDSSIRFRKNAEVPVLLVKLSLKCSQPDDSTLVTYISPVLQAVLLTLGARKRVATAIFHSKFHSG